MSLINSKVFYEDKNNKIQFTNGAKFGAGLIGTGVSGVTVYWAAKEILSGTYRNTSITPIMTTIGLIALGFTIYSVTTIIKSTKALIKAKKEKNEKKKKQIK